MRRRKSYTKIALVLVLGVLLLTSCSSPTATSPITTTSVQTTTTTSTTSETVDPFIVWWEDFSQPFTLNTTNYCSFFRGAWGSRLDELRGYLLNAEKLREAGVDTIMVEAEIVLDRETHEPKSIGDDVFIFYIQALKNAGFRIVLIPNPMHPNLDQGLGYDWENNDANAFYHPGFELIKKFDEVVVQWAQIAEEYSADAFLPILEPYKLAGDYNTASRWLQEILPQIKAVYHGPVWGTDGMYDTSPGRSIPTPYDYGGYDLLLSGPPAGWKEANSWEDMMEGFIGKGLEYVNDYGLEGFGLYEYGGYTGGIWYEDTQMGSFDQILSQEQAAD
ncbi:MAG: hypothetical protein PHG35_05045, partial [Dehalococcoidales bacterium]|nr:hypothetical protein [Dehalococcoidales bacterium]